MKKIICVGAGVAGSYLTALLRDDFEVVVYDSSSSRRGCSCAWGSTRSLLRSKLLNVGLNLQDYVLCVPQQGFINGVCYRVADGVFFDKRKMIRDLVPEVVPRHVSFEEEFDTDLIVNATAKPLAKAETVNYTIQWKARVIGAESKTVYFWLDPDHVGYGWIFPLDEEGKLFHVGAGTLDGTVESVGLVLETLKRYKLRIVGKAICACWRPLYIGRNMPIVKDNIVSIGEAAGCVHPLTGEGILPSIQSAEFLAESLKQNDSLYTYVSKLQEFLAGYEEAFDALETVKKHRRLGMIKVFKVLSKRMTRRTKPAISWQKKLKFLWKCVS